MKTVCKNCGEELTQYPDPVKYPNEQHSWFHSKWMQYFCQPGNKTTHAEPKENK